MRKYLAIAITLTATIAGAYAQQSPARVSLDASKPPPTEECSRLQQRIKELDRMDDERIARAGQVGAQQSPVQTKEWIDKERKDAKTAMFFAKC
ncbi:hypothetical protein [Paraherbaspirillum soli]|uniref:Secreted protein n=1 Tax=Paraherbaspirillum soli TaxID=631222 RepID=A0ABW0M8V5_9BURK